MGMLKMKVMDAAGAALAGKTVKVSGAGALQTSSEGMAQFLIDSDASIEIEIDGAVAWSGNASLLAREERFQLAGAKFARVSA